MIREVGTRRHRKSEGAATKAIEATAMRGTREARST